MKMAGQKYIQVQLEFISLLVQNDDNDDKGWEGKKDEIEIFGSLEKDQ